MSKSPKQLPNCLKRAEQVSFSSFLMLSSMKSVLKNCYHFLPLLNMNQVPEKLYLGQ